MSKVKEGDLVKVYTGPGEPPYEAIVMVVDSATGIITRVRKADDKTAAWIDVSMSIVLLVEPIVRIVRWFRNLFKRKK